MSNKSFSWALDQLKAGAKVALSNWKNKAHYLIIRDNTIQLVDSAIDTSTLWAAPHSELLSESWGLFSELTKEYVINCTIVVGYAKDNQQHDYGYYTRLNAGQCKAFTTNISDQVKLATCSGYTKPGAEGFLVQLVNKETEKTLSFLKANPNADLIVEINGEKYPLGSYLSVSSVNNYYWENTDEVRKLRQKYFKPETVNKQYVIKLTWLISN